MKVMLVDDHALVIEGLRNLLTANGVEVVGTACGGLEALAKARALRPEVILMDIQMPGCNGLQATRLIKAEMPEIKIVMLTVSGLDEDLFEAIKSGASGYLLKKSEAREFLGLLAALEQGEAPLARGLAAKILTEFARVANTVGRPAGAGDDEGERLTNRQGEVLMLVARGLTYKEIGEVLCLTERTVTYHVAQILERLRLKNRAQAIAYAQRKGLVPGTGNGRCDALCE